MSPASTIAESLDRIRRGQTDAIFDLCAHKEWEAALTQESVSVWQWLVYFNDVTAIRYLQERSKGLGNLKLDEEIGNAAFFGHWQMCRFLIEQGANVQTQQPDTNETPLHSALSKAGRPYYKHVVKLLLKHGANPNAQCTVGQTTGAFMRDVRTRGETPLHRAAAYADVETISLLMEYGADVRAVDAFGDSPMSYASFHLRPAAVLKLLEFGSHKIHPDAVGKWTSDHGCGWGNGMDINLMGEPGEHD